MNKRPSISVIMPVYQVAAYIRQAVDSVLNQTFDDFELLLIDDESPDNSIELIQQHTRDPRLRVLRQTNRGLAGARNAGIAAAQGDILAFLDSDDFWHPDKLMKHSQLMLADANIGVSFSASLFVNEGGESLNRVQSPVIKEGYSARTIFCRNPIGNGSAPLLRRSVLEEIAFKGINKLGESVDYWQYFDESLKQSEDIDCWTRIALATGTRFTLIDEPLTFYRLNNAGLSADVESQLSTWMVFYQKLQRVYPDFIAQHGSAAMAYQYRYLARRCVSQAKGRQALMWIGRALTCNTVALMDEWRRTLVTVFASLLMAALPESIQKRIVERVIG